MWRRLLAIAGWALPQPSANLNPMPSVARLSRACAVRPGCPAQLGVMFSPSQRLAAWWLCAIARTGKGGSFVSRGVPCRVVGTSRRLRLLRLPTLGTGDGFPRHALLNTARGYCSPSVFKEPSVVTADPLTLSLLCLLRWVNCKVHRTVWLILFLLQKTQVD